MDGGETGALYATVVSLVLVWGAAAAAAVFLRRWKGSIGRSAGPMQLRHVIALGPRERLCLRHGVWRSNQASLQGAL